MELSVARQVPIGNGILTVDTAAQAWVRASVEQQDKGGDAARAALALVALKRGFGTTPAKTPTRKR
jgi:6,7-dimethyl-8-ribityllumazine synthase